ncbi:MAG TPA: ABC transporter permease [Syntrophomonas sp.]|nr:ABC transporter permease [Syntrophomonas sp.]
MTNSTIKNSLITALSILAMLLTWYVLALLIGKEYILPTPAKTGQNLLMIVGSADFWPAVLTTIGRGLLGFLISLVLGIVLGMAAGFSRLVSWLLRPWVTVMRSTPVMSIIILAIIWFESNLVPVVVTILMLFPIIYGNVVAGIRNINQELLEMARMYKVMPLRIINELYLPSILPYLLAGAATAMGIAWKVIIAAEILSQPNRAIGTDLMIAKINFATAQVFAWTVVVIAISFVFEYILNALENNLTKWRK